MSLSGLYVFQPRGLQRLELGPWGLRLWVNDQWYYVILYVRISTSTIKRGLSGSQAALRRSVLQDSEFGPVWNKYCHCPVPCLGDWLGLSVKHGALGALFLNLIGKGCVAMLLLKVASIEYPFDNFSKRHFPINKMKIHYQLDPPSSCRRPVCISLVCMHYNIKTSSQLKNRNLNISLKLFLRCLNVR